MTYAYGGDGKRRERTSGGVTTLYRWDIGWNMINEENSLGALTRTYVGRTLAHIEGTNPVTGAARYYSHDNLGSSRSVRNADKSLYACRARQAARRRFYVPVAAASLLRISAAGSRCHLKPSQGPGIASLRSQ